jgi:acetyl-CoA synthetase
VLHSHQSYPVGHLSTMYWIGLQPGDVHWNISSPGWAKHAWSCFFAPWNAGATVFVYNYERFSAPGLLDVIARCGVTSLCAPPTVWRMMIQEDLAAWKLPLRELVGAGEPLNPEVIEQVERAWGIRIRDGFGQSETCAQIGNSPGQLVKPGSMGRPLPGYRVALLDIDDAAGGEGEIASLEPRPVGLMLGYEGDSAKTAEVMRGGFTHRRHRHARRRRLLFLRRPQRRRVQVVRLPHQPLRTRERADRARRVLEAAVVPSPDPLRLSVPKAYITLWPGVEPTREVAAGHLRVRARAAWRRTSGSAASSSRRELPKTISGVRSGDTVELRLRIIALGSLS